MGIDKQVIQRKIQVEDAFRKSSSALDSQKKHSVTRNPDAHMHTYSKNKTPDMSSTLWYRDAVKSMQTKVV